MTLSLDNAVSFIGIDWGTTHRRACLLDGDGQVVHEEHDDDGALACTGRFAESLCTLLQRLGPLPNDVPIVMAGMVGSAMGWQEVPYAEARTPLRDLARQLAPVRDAPVGARWWIVPGMRWVEAASGQVDVMRGEETQLLGASQTLGAAGGAGCCVLPGTHSKWVRLEAGVVQSLRTFMSGELFALLRERGTLSAAMKTTPAESALDRPAFARGVADATHGALSHTLFGARARVVTGQMPAEAASAYVSGLLIGSEWHEHARSTHRGDTVRLIGEPALAQLHVHCAELLGCRAEVLDVRAVQHAAWRTLQRSLETTP